MFGGKKSEINNTGNGVPTASGVSNIIVSGTSIEGNINANGDIRIDGILLGNLNCKGKVIIGPDGAVEGNINCGNAVIEGKFEGNLVCSELLNVRESANIKGDIKTDKLIVQSGAVYNVTCVMGQPEVKPLQKASA